MKLAYPQSEFHKFLLSEFWAFYKGWSPKVDKDIFEEPRNQRVFFDHNSGEVYFKFVQIFLRWRLIQASTSTQNLIFCKKYWSLLIDHGAQKSPKNAQNSDIKNWGIPIIWPRCTCIKDHIV